MKLSPSLLRWTGAALLAVSLTASAQMRIEIQGVGSTQIPIAIAAFSNEGLTQQQLSAIVRADLERSGYFRVTDPGVTIADNVPVDLASWKARGVDALAVGSVQTTADGRYSVRYKLYDTIKGTDISGTNENVGPTAVRMAAHRVADDIYLKLTGVRGAFATRISYVSQTGRNHYELDIADSDGEGKIPALTSTAGIISPTWSPDGSKVAYVSMQAKKPIVYVQDLARGTQRIVSNEKGNNSAPAWSPDGRTLAVSLSKDGHTQIYLVSAEGGGLRRLSNGPGIDTEARFAPDGQSIYFTSDRSGGPQIYRMPVSGGAAERVTFYGPYNISPRVSPDGKTLVYIGQRDGGFNLYALDLASGQELKLAENAGEPSFSPNGRYIMYATGGARKTLAVVSVDGRVKQTLSVQATSISEPSWGPFLQ